MLEARHLEELLAGKPSSLAAPETRKTVAPAAVAPAAATNRQPTQVAVSIQGPLPKPHGAYNFRNWNANHTVFEAKTAYIKDYLAAFFGVNQRLVIEETPLPDSVYNLLAEAPTNQLFELQTRFVEMLRTNLGLSVELTNRELDVYEMTLVSTNVPGLRSNLKTGGGGQISGGFRLRGATMDSVASFFEIYSDKPVVNETEASGRWGVEVEWKLSDPELLPEQLDNAVWRFFQTNKSANASYPLPAGLRDRVSSNELELLKSEMARPQEHQFEPDFDRVIKAAREQAGLEIKPARRRLPVVVVRAGQPQGSDSTPRD